MTRKLLNMRSSKILVIILFALVSCTGTENRAENRTKAFPRVATTKINRGNIMQKVEMKATAHYLKSDVIASPIDGYIVESFAKAGDNVRKGHILFTVQTRESMALGTEGRILDNGIDFSGMDTILAFANGYITETNHQRGDFVSKGEKLATIRETSSLVFILNMPVEWRDKVHTGLKVSLHYPDQSIGTGIVVQVSPEVERASQTQKVIIAVENPEQFPEGLIASVWLPVSESLHAILLSREALLSNETETEYWVMKMVNDSIAVKTPVTTGIMNRDTVEIVNPVLHSGDRILIHGNYALPDTVQVTLTDSF